MSKSLGNIKTIRETLKQYDFETLRYFLISSHYRSPLDYTSQALADAAAAVDRFYEMTVRLSPSPFPLPSRERVKGEGAAEKQLQKALESLEDRIAAFMDDDFNTAGAMGVIFELVRLTNRYLDNIPSPLAGEGQGEGEKAFTAYLSSKWHELQKTLDNIFGMFNSVPAEYQSRRKKMATSTKGVDASIVEQLIADRANARKSKDFAKADAVKKQLADMGVELKDKPDGTTEWKIK
ncbi:MAG: hypothetical protein HYU98_06875 [Deltaproteobacteria bacterium]|nr:hypothetical protein [Deltaproteobacteria bacterium]